MTDQRDGDLAAQAANEMQIEHVEKILATGEDIVDLESPMVREVRRSIFAKIEFRWRASDEKILEQIRAGVDLIVRNSREDAKAIMDELYAQMRVPVVNEETGVVQTDSQGRVLWQKNPGGRVREDWSQLTGQDIEQALLNIHRLKIDLAPRVNALLNEAVFAKHIADDAHDDAYLKLVDDTVAARNAYASQKAREDKYHAYFRYYLWSSADVFLRELRDFARVLERIRYWRIDDGGKTTSGARPRY